MTRYVVFANIGLFLGYLNGLYLYYSASVLKLTLCLLLISVFFYIGNRSDRKTFVMGIIFSIFFIYGTIFGHIIEVRNVNSVDTVLKNIEGEFVLQEINIKDTSQVLVFENMVVYTKNIEQFTPGESIFIQGQANAEIIMYPKYLREFKSFNFNQYWSTKGKDLIVFYPKLSVSTSTPIQKGFKYYTYQVRTWFFKNIEHSMPGKEAGIVTAMVWGDERYITQETKLDYRAVGISHILVLSGFNLAIIASFTSIMLRRVSLLKSSIITGSVIILFLLISEGGISLYRAAIMTFFSMYAGLFLKQNNSVYILWLIFLGFSITSIDIALYDVSFHLSFLATLGIVCFFTPVKELIKKRYNLDNILIDLILVTCSATLTTTPYIIYTFGFFKISSIIFAIVAGMIAPISTVVGIFASFLGSVSYLGKIIGYFAYFPIHLLNIFIDTFTTDALNNPVVVSLLTVILEYLCIYIFYLFVVFINLTYVKTPKSK